MSRRCSCAGLAARLRCSALAAAARRAGEDRDRDPRSHATQIENNVRAFLSLTRYAERTDVTQEVMSRLQRRIVTETRARSSRSATTSPKSSTSRRRRARNGGSRFTSPRAGRCACRRSRSTSPGRAPTSARLREVHRGRGPEARLAPESRRLRARERRTCARSEERRLSRRKLTKNELLIDRIERRATVELELDTGERYQLRRDRDRAGRHQRRRDAPAAAHEGRRSLHARFAAAHAVRARRHASTSRASTSTARDPIARHRTVPVKVRPSRSAGIASPRAWATRTDTRGARQIHLGQPPRESTAATASRSS